ncbi:MAG: hypothetical protein U1E56_04560 [Bauldia sp.]
MPKTSFTAQALTETTTRTKQDMFELVFAGADGDTLTLSVPMRVAIENLAPVLASLASSTAPADKPAEYSKTVLGWRVGHLQGQRRVLLQFNNEIAYNLYFEDAKKLWHQLREEAEVAGRSGPAKA